jgi:hypothetical protein
MATSVASDEASAAADPFTSNPPGPARLRHSAFDANLFSLGPGASAEQAKRAIEAHLADTERRMEEAGKLGNALLLQQKELTDRLKEVEQLQAEGELTPELRQRLTEIEKEYNEVARETARAFLPKSRVPSSEAAAGSPFPPEGKGGRVSVVYCGDIKSPARKTDAVIYVAFCEPFQVRESSNWIASQVRGSQSQITKPASEPYT